MTQNITLQVLQEKFHSNYICYNYINDNQGIRLHYSEDRT